MIHANFPKGLLNMPARGGGIGSMGLGGHHHLSSVSTESLPDVGKCPVQVSRVDKIYSPFQGSPDKHATLGRGYVGLQVTQGKTAEDEGRNVKTSIAKLYSVQSVLLDSGFCVGSLDQARSSQLLTLS